MPEPVSARPESRAGFTLVELVVAMAVFSMMLLIIVSGILNIVRMHNQAIASNLAQDNGRAIMDELVTSIRNSAGVDWTKSTLSDVNGDTRLCVMAATGPGSEYYVNKFTTAGVNYYVLYRHDGGCTAGGGVAISNTVVRVLNFSASPGTTVGTKQEVRLSVTVGSTNDSLVGGNLANGAGTQCRANNVDREFCSTVTLTSGAVPR